VRDRSVLDVPALDTRVPDDAGELFDPLSELTGPRTGRSRAVPAPVEVLTSAPRSASPRAATPRTAASAASRPSASGAATPRGRHRLPRPPRRRAPLLLAALSAGGLLAAVLGVVPTAGPASPVGDASDYGLSAAESNFAGGMEDADARREITAAEAESRLSDLAASRAQREPDYVLPTDGIMSTCFCQRWGQMHWGIDLAAPLGTPIVAAADGVVLRAGPASGYGNAIYIQDADGNVEIYGHMRYMSVEAGDVVSAGDVIAKVGSEGQSTGPHLHFEIHLGSMTGRPTDPEAWLNDRGIEVPGS
jgi:murein DD-endopeptidase MepM/ murein hydrolase activator NlpD